MDVLLAVWLTRLLAGYAGIGFLFALYFVFRGVNRIDPNAKQGTWGFRVLIFPGSLIFWPLLVKRLLAGQEVPPVEVTAHRKASEEGDRSHD